MGPCIPPGPDSPTPPAPVEGLPPPSPTSLSVLSTAYEACVFSRVHGIFPGHDYWSGLPFPPPEDPPSQGIESMSPASPALQADSLPLSSRGSLLEHCLKLRQSLGPITPSSAIPIPTPANLRPGPRLQSSRSLRDSVLEQPSDSYSRPRWCSKGPESALPQPEPREEGSRKIQGPPPGPGGGCCAANTAGAAEGGRQQRGSAPWTFCPLLYENPFIQY